MLSAQNNIRVNPLRQKILNLNELYSYTFKSV